MKLQLGESTSMLQIVDYLIVVGTYNYVQVHPNTGQVGISPAKASSENDTK
jgi:hypothetical protein